MKRRHFLLAAGSAALLATPQGAWAQQLSLGALSNYLNSLKAVEAEFTQINADGTISTGKIFIKRPGRVLFQYNPPDTQVVVATGGEVVIVDPASNIRPESYPLSQTPLSIILADNINLGRARMVTNHSYDGTATVVTAQDPDHPEYGNIQLKFTGPTPQLRQWIINNDQGSTTVILGDLKTGVSLPNSMFAVGKYFRDSGPDR